MSSLLKSEAPQLITSQALYLKSRFITFSRVRLFQKSLFRCSYETFSLFSIPDSFDTKLTMTCLSPYSTTNA